MRVQPGVALVVVSLVLASCGDNGEELETAEVSAADTAAMGMPPRGMSGGMGPMAGMGQGTMMGDWEQHMAAMHGASGDSLRAMMGRHRPMAMRMMEAMDSAPGRMGMPMDSAWMATRDSLRRDLERMQGISPEQMEAFLEAHDARMRRMLEMHRSMTEPAQQ